jgi:hypothetical protein
MSSSHSRVKRAPVSRTGPNRNSLYSAPKCADPAAGTARGPDKALENGVKAAYAVIDEYIRRGREEARNCQTEHDTRGSMNNQKPYGNYSNPNNPWGAMPMLAEQMMGAVRMWTSAWSAFMPPGFPQQPWNPAEMWGQPQARPAATVSVSVHVVAHSPTDVTAQLRPGCETMQLVVPPLHNEAGGTATITQVSISRDSSGLKVSVTVPKDVPAGTYCGPIREMMSGAEAGQLSVKVMADPGSSA